MPLVLFGDLRFGKYRKWPSEESHSEYDERKLETSYGMVWYHTIPYGSESS